MRWVKLGDEGNLESSPPHLLRVKGCETDHWQNQASTRVHPFPCFLCWSARRRDGDVLETLSSCPPRGKM